MKVEELNLDFTQPRVMAIVNVTPDSFYSGSRTFDPQQIEERVRQVVREGASIIDIGGYSSRPGADIVNPEEEWRRVAEGLEIIRKTAPEMPVSVDTFRAEVARRAVETFGAVIINDISAGELDPEMLPLVAQYGVPYIAMHMVGDPQTMQSQTDYTHDITTEVVIYLSSRVEKMLTAGIRRDRIILDPGFGFAKTLEQNYHLLSELHLLCTLGFPVLAGLSRKSMIYKLLGTSPAEALSGTIALDWECLRQGAVILRVHDVREAVDTIKIFKQFRS